MFRLRRRTQGGARTPRVLTAALPADGSLPTVPSLEGYTIQELRTEELAHLVKLNELRPEQVANLIRALTRTRHK